MKDNLYSNLSKFSISSILYRYMFDSTPDRVQLGEGKYLIYPLGIQSGVCFHNGICSNIFDNAWIKYFKNPSDPTPVNSMIHDKDFLHELFTLINNVYNLDDSVSLYDLLQQCNTKQLKYLLYTIKNQNFTYTEINKTDEYTYSIIDIVTKMDSILVDYHKSKAGNKNMLVDIEAVEYSNINPDEVNIDYTSQFYKDYVIGNEAFYNLLVNSYMNKFLALSEDAPFLIKTDSPQYWCKINNNQCIQSCRMFDPHCLKRYLKSYSYFPFKSLYVLPQLLSLVRSRRREWDIDNVFRGIMYAVSITFGKTENLKAYTNLFHNDPVAPLIEKNKINMVKSFFGTLNFNEIENEVRTALGLSENKEDSVENLQSILIKIYTFIETNKKAFVRDDTRLAIVNNFLDVEVRNFLFNYDCTITGVKGKDIVIQNQVDFSSYIGTIISEILMIENMLMKFPNDMQNIDSMANGLLKSLRNAKVDLAKAGGVTVINPRETLLSSTDTLFKRIAVDDSLYSFYKQNNRTKLVNNILFWKQSISLFYYADVILHLSDDHEIMKMDFNDV